ncbi:hypothetical protein [Streptomyces albidus (ex Kaewkla and Franco 2022)]|nr:hypothetical protein [Streptomyces albidus (ex Kaewkla and Franco 2022)]
MSPRRSGSRDRMILSAAAPIEAAAAEIHELLAHTLPDRAGPDPRP